MADKRRLGPQENQHERVVDPGIFNKTIIILLRLAGYKLIITNWNLALCNSLVIYHFISSTPSRNNNYC